MVDKISGSSPVRREEEGTSVPAKKGSLQSRRASKELASSSQKETAEETSSLVQRTFSQSTSSSTSRKSSATSGEVPSLYDELKALEDNEERGKKIKALLKTADESTIQEILDYLGSISDADQKEIFDWLNLHSLYLLFSEDEDSVEIDALLDVIASKINEGIQDNGKDFPGLGKAAQFLHTLDTESQTRIISTLDEEARLLLSSSKSTASPVDDRVLQILARESELQTEESSHSLISSDKTLQLLCMKYLTLKNPSSKLDLDHAIHQHVATHFSLQMEAQNAIRQLRATLDEAIKIQQRKLELFPEQQAATKAEISRLEHKRISALEIEMLIR